LRLTGLLVLILALVSSGCAASHAPVVEYDAGGARGGGTMSTRPAKITRGAHQVTRGDTLFSIAWRYGWDYRELAAANGISAPYTIHPGQRIHLDRRAPQTTASAPSRPPSPPPAARPGTPARPSTPAPAPTPAPPARSPSATSTPSGTGAVTWRWPANGQLISGFSAAGQRGIAIAGREGDPVLAAADGVVVYRGNGLTGYGNLLIIKHNDRWLSAYAHNHDMLVREGERVRIGQRIASMGATGTFRTQLHFEIRRDGQPVDPTSLLPKRS
jgi:lipoprotein NlpD